MLFANNSFIYELINLFKLKIAYALTSKGDIKHRLEYAFDVYDLDKNGFITADEIKAVIPGILKLLRAEKEYHSNISELASLCIAQLDIAKDGKISRGKIVDK